MENKKIVLKILSGIPIGIAIIETLNIIISINFGYYIRIGGTELNQVLKTYIFSVIYGILIMCSNQLFNISTHKHNTLRTMILQVPIISFIIIPMSSYLVYLAINTFGQIISFKEFMIGIMFPIGGCIIIEFILYIIDKQQIKKINKVLLNKKKME